MTTGFTPELAINGELAGFNPLLQSRARIIAEQLRRNLVETLPIQFAGYNGVEFDGFYRAAWHAEFHTAFGGLKVL